MYEHLFDIVVAILIGTLCGFGAVGFRLLVDFFHGVFWSLQHPTLEGIEQVAMWRRVLAPALGGLAAGPVIYYLAREAKGHGVPEVMLAVIQNKGVIRVRVAFAKAFASALTIASGGSAGREGPIIQIGAAGASWIGQMLQVSGRKLKTFVGCGAAAGIAATFNAPIAGALFAVEVILGEFGVAQFSPIVVSSVLATVIARHYFGSGPVFHVPGYELVSVLEFLPYVLLGFGCGLVSRLFVRALYYSEDRFDGWSRLHPVWRPMVGGACLGVLALASPLVYGDGYQAINLALNNQLPVLMLVGLLFAKILATSLTLGSGGSGGVFAPSLFMGAMLGGALGHGVAFLFGDSAGAAGGYALVAMGGVVAGTTLAPIMAILIIFEITSNYAVILPLMTVCITSTVISRAMSRDSIYTTKLARRGINLFQGQSLDLLKSVPVSECMVTEVITFGPGAPIRLLMDRMITGEEHQFCIVDEQGDLFGVVSVSDLRRILMHREGLEQVLLAEDLAHESLPVCHPMQSLSQALVQFEGSGLTELPVVEEVGSRRLVGVLRYADVFARYNQQVMQLDSAEAMSQRMASSAGKGSVRLVKDFSMRDWDPPQSVWGQSLAEAALPARYHVRVLLVKKKAQSTAGVTEVVPLVPGPDYVIEDDDTLVIYGRDEDLERVARL